MQQIGKVPSREDKLCFCLYAASKELVKSCRPILDQLNLTYTQYLVMLALWAHEEPNVKELGELLFLDSGTLTPVLKSLEAKGFVRRIRSTQDERVLLLELTDEGKALRDNVGSVPETIDENVKLDEQERMMLYGLLHKLLDGVKEAN